MFKKIPAAAKNGCRKIWSLYKKNLPLSIALSCLGTAVLSFLVISIVMIAQPLSSAYSLSAEQESYTLHIGDEEDLILNIEGHTSRPYLLFLQKLKKITYTSSDESVVTIDANGRIHAAGEGSAVLSADVSDFHQDFPVTCYVPGEQLRFGKDAYDLRCGFSLKPTVSVYPENAVLFEELTYKSLDEYIVRISEDGKMKALNPGSTEIIVSADGLTARAKVSVYQPMKRIVLQDLPWDGVVNLERGETHQFRVEYFPLNTTDDRTTTYTLSNDEAGTIDENGLFTATGRGPAIMTATCGSHKDSVPIFVNVTMTDIALSKDSASLVYPNTDQLTWTPVPEDTTAETEVRWISTNTSVIKVDKNGVVTPTGGGTADAVLTVNGFEKRCTYTVTVPITSVAISRGNLTLYLGDSAALSAHVVPTFTTENKDITWTSDNPAIMAVNGNGGIYAAGLGTTVIRATHGRFQAACVVSVIERPFWGDVADSIINYGKQFLGTPYVWGGNNMRGGIDCSGFTKQCFAVAGIGLSRTSYTQVNQGAPISLDPAEWRKGDLIFYSKNGRVYHVGIYIGDGQILQSSESQGGVCISPYDYNGMVPSHVRRYFF